MTEPKGIVSREQFTECYSGFGSGCHTVQGGRCSLVRLRFVDFFGFMKNVVIPKSEIDRALHGAMMLDGFSMDSFARINKSGR